MYGDNIYPNFCCFNVAEDGVECKRFYENKYYLQVYLDNCTFKIINTEMIDYDGNVFKTDQFLSFRNPVLDRIDLSELIDDAKSNNSKECMAFSLLVF